MKTIRCDKVGTHRISTGLSTGGNMLNWLFGRTKVRPMTDADLFEAVRQLRHKLDLLQDEHEKLVAQHLSVRGRVYALWGKGKGSEEAQEPLPLTDPRLTKAQLRAALIASGRLGPQSQEK